MKTLKKLWQLPKTIRDFLLRLISDQCGGELSGKNIALAFAGLTAATVLVVAWGFLIVVAYTPHC